MSKVFHVHDHYVIYADDTILVYSGRNCKAFEAQIKYRSQITTRVKNKKLAWLKSINERHQLWNRIYTKIQLTKKKTHSSFF